MMAELSPLLKEVSQDADLTIEVFRRWAQAKMDRIAQLERENAQLTQVARAIAGRHGYEIGEIARQAIEETE
jgi:hypothetical protein